MHSLASPIANSCSAASALLSKLLIITCVLLTDASDAADVLIDSIRIKNSTGESPVTPESGRMRARHWADITTLSYHPDGSLLASGGEDEAVRIWNADTLELVDSICFLGQIVRKVAFCGDGRLIVVTSEAKDEVRWMYSSSLVSIYESVAGQWLEQARIAGFQHNIQSIAVTPDSKRLFLDDGVQAIHSYSLEKERPLWIDTAIFPATIGMGGPNFPRMQGIPIPPKIASGPILPLIMGQPSYRNGEKPLAMQVTKDGRYLIALTSKNLYCFNVNGIRVPISQVAVSAHALAVAPNGRQVWIADGAKGVSAVDLSEVGKLALQPTALQINQKGVTTLAISAGGECLMLGSAPTGKYWLSQVEDDKIAGPPMPIDVEGSGDPLGLGNQPFYWVYSLLNDSQDCLPAVFHPLDNSLAVTQSRRQLEVFNVNPDATAEVSQRDGVGDAIALWDAADRQLRWLDDNQTLFVTSKSGGAKVDITTAEVSDVTESLTPMFISLDGKSVWGTERIQGGLFSPFQLQLQSGAKKTLSLPSTGSSTWSTLRISPDGTMTAQVSDDKRKISIYDLNNEQTRSIRIAQSIVHVIGFDSANRFWVAYLALSDANEMQHHLVRIDLGAGINGKAETPYQVVVAKADIVDPTQQSFAPELDQFAISRNGEVVVFRERTGLYRVISDTKSQRSRTSIQPIQAVSNDGAFFVTLFNETLGCSCLRVIRATDGQVIQSWRFPGIITSLDLSVDEKTIATANSNGSISVLKLRDRQDWPAETSELALESESPEQLKLLEASLQKMVADFAPESQAFEAKLNAAASKDEQTQVECEEPYSAYILRLLAFARKNSLSDVAYQAMHIAIGTKRVTPPHVPGASWSDKRLAWYAVSSKADQQLSTIARLEFVGKFIDDPRTASALRSVIKYWVHNETERVIFSSWEIYLRSKNERVKAGALLIYAEANMGEQRKFLTSGHRVTDPTDEQLGKARAALEKIVREYPSIEIEGVGNVAEVANGLLKQKALEK